MKLVEALQLKERLEDQMADTLELISKCCKAQEGSKPPLDPDVLFQEYEALEKELIDITVRIQNTNNAITFKYLNSDTAKTMTQALAELDALKMQRLRVNYIVTHGIIENDRWSSKKILDVSYVDVAKYYKLKQELLDQWHSLKMSIQSANMEFDLI
ncbi:hypothetical protein Cantr_07585 [Candida viswanathii]|uniref:Uncharacterized protein n=1 Tax=Candida viswanathii TaxID=5486 RepID=A0A367Y0F5_9ASCO|nr:hypothetical protein Cantr_07585 [Candida viswanathii]